MHLNYNQACILLCSLNQFNIKNVMISLEFLLAKNKGL